MSDHTPYRYDCGCQTMPSGLLTRCPLHATAPALLEALEGIMSYVPCGAECELTPYWLNKARAAIKAAKRESA